MTFNRLPFVHFHLRSGGGMIAALGGTKNSNTAINVRRVRPPRHEFWSMDRFATAGDAISFEREIRLKCSNATLVSHANGDPQVATRADARGEMTEPREAAQSIDIDASAEAAPNANRSDVFERLRWSWQHSIAVVASVIAGVAIGSVFTGDTDPIIEDRGRLIAQGSLASALTEHPSRAIDRQSGVRIGVSFLTKGGDYCRTFTLERDATLAGLACNRDQVWSIDALTRMRSDASAAYRMAGAAVPALILGLVEDTIAGEPLDAELEAEARARDWKR